MALALVVVGTAFEWWLWTATFGAGAIAYGAVLAWALADPKVTK
jgi:hypothetical protein